mmetsp:Transcript_36874/g.78241  ORF Transcript_36874/g.78241 Transcript_36874/m.78241 type:complete len:98 (+) Transcript_36874:68-361(+)
MLNPHSRSLIGCIDSEVQEIYAPHRNFDFQGRQPRPLARSASLASMSTTASASELTGPATTQNGALDVGGEVPELRAGQTELFSAAHVAAGGLSEAS